MQPIVGFVIGLVALIAATFWARRRPRARGAVLAIALGLGVLTAVFGRRDSVPGLDAAALAAARARWEARGPRDYDLSIEVHADRLDEARYDVSVRSGDVVRTTRDGTPTQSAEESWTVAAIFTMLERELELGREPQAAFGAPPGYRAYLFASFDAETGIPRRYRRVVGGTTNGVELRVVRFQAAR